MSIHAQLLNVTLKKYGLWFTSDAMNQPETLQQTLISVRYNLRKIATMAKKLIRDEKIHGKALTIRDRVKMMKDQGVVIQYKGLTELNLDLILKWVPDVDKKLSELEEAICRTLEILNEIGKLLGKKQIVLAFSFLQQNGNQLPSVPTPLVSTCMNLYFELQGSLQSPKIAA